jgi:hypothetical protein
LKNKQMLNATLSLSVYLSIFSHLSKKETVTKFTEFA